jgi:hypothetical protein
MCWCAEVSRASCSVLRLRVLVSMVPSSSSKSCTSGIGSPSIGSLSLLDSLCQTLYRSNTGMAPLVLSLPFRQYVWNVFPVLFDQWFLSIRITLEFGFVSSISLSDRYSGGRPMSSAILKKVESNVTAGTGRDTRTFHLVPLHFVRQLQGPLSCANAGLWY